MDSAAALVEANPGLEWLDVPSQLEEWIPLVMRSTVERVGADEG